MAHQTCLQLHLINPEDLENRSPSADHAWPRFPAVLRPGHHPVKTESTRQYPDGSAIVSYKDSGTTTSRFCKIAIEVSHR